MSAPHPEQGPEVEQGLPSTPNTPPVQIPQTAQNAQTADGDWHRVHPISPLVRGWLVVAGLLFFFIQSAGEDLVQVLFEGGEFRAARGLGISLAVFGGIFVLSMIGFFLSWRFTRYRLTPQTVQLHTGIIFRQRREVRLDRVQAVDLRQPLLARIVGLAELKFEAADGGSSAMALEFIKRDEAEALRREIMGRASGIQSGVDHDIVADSHARAAENLATDPADPSDSLGQALPDDGRDLALEGDGAVVGKVDTGRSGMHEAPERVMLQVPAGRLIGSVLLGTGMTTLVVAAISLGVVLGVIWWFNGQELPPEATRGVLLGSIPVGISSVGAVWSQFNSGYNFTVATASDGLRLRYGLLETSQQTVPPGRVQAIKVYQPLLWRPFGWHRVVVNVAGYGNLSEATDAKKSMVLPVGPFEDVLRVLSIVAPDPGVREGEDAAEVIRTGVVGFGEDHGYRHSPRSARWVDPLTWRRNAVRATQTMVLIRGGRLSRRLVLMPHDRLQSISVEQGPLERRLGLANVNMHSTTGPVAPRLQHASVAVALELFEQESAIAAVSRRMSDRNQWMRPEERARFERRTVEAVEKVEELSDERPAATAADHEPQEPAR